MKNIYWLEELNKDSLKIAGGKGANLAEMANSGFRVPEAFIISADSYFDFIQRNNLHEIISKETENLDYENSSAVQKASETIKTAVFSARMQPDLAADITLAYNKLSKTKSLIPSSSEEVFVAVRSSATAEDLPQASFAGQ